MRVLRYMKVARLVFNRADFHFSGQTVIRITSTLRNWLKKLRKGAFALSFDWFTGLSM